jgi:hypothetical protein
VVKELLRGPWSNEYVRDPRRIVFLSSKRYLHLLFYEMVIGTAARRSDPDPAADPVTRP